MEHIWTMLMHKILQNHLLCAFAANLKIDAIYALYPESFCYKNLAIRKVFAFCDSAWPLPNNDCIFWHLVWYCLYTCKQYKDWNRSDLIRVLFSLCRSGHSGRAPCKGGLMRLSSNQARRTHNNDPFNNHELQRRLITEWPYLYL